jgi:putative tryptophan/tyrosine transport system substrate-binding protein
LSCCCTARSYLVRRKPADLLVEQVTPFQTVLNLATAKKLGPLVPSSPLLRADEVFD